MFEKITNDLTEAMKAKDTFKTSVLRMLKSALIYEKTNGSNHELSDDDVINVIKKQIKTRKSSMEEYVSYNRMDLADSLKNEIDILSIYLPEELTDEELEKIVNDTIANLNADSIKQMGMVIKTISSEYGTRCDMSKVSKLVKEKLS